MPAQYLTGFGPWLAARGARACSNPVPPFNAILAVSPWEYRILTSGLFCLHLLPPSPPRRISELFGGVFLLGGLAAVPSWRARSTTSGRTTRATVHHAHPMPTPRPSAAPAHQPATGTGPPTKPTQRSTHPHTAPPAHTQRTHPPTPSLHGEPPRSTNHATTHATTPRGHHDHHTTTRSHHHHHATTAQGPPPPSSHVPLFIHRVAT